MLEGPFNELTIFGERKKAHIGALLEYPSHVVKRQLRPKRADVGEPK